MTEKLAYKLINTYVQGWKKSDVKLISKPLSSDCLIVESHGPTYRGIEMVKEWVKMWVSSGYKVTKWDIISFYYFGKAAVFEWIFECVIKNTVHYVEGVTVVVFDKYKIKSLHEYRMTKSAYDWNESSIGE